MNPCHGPFSVLHDFHPEMILLARFNKGFSTTDIIDGLTVKEELTCVRNRMKIK